MRQLVVMPSLLPSMYVPDTGSTKWLACSSAGAELKVSFLISHSSTFPLKLGRTPRGNPPSRTCGEDRSLRKFGDSSDQAKHLFVEANWNRRSRPTGECKKNGAASTGVRRFLSALSRAGPAALGPLAPMTSELQSDDALKFAKPNCVGSTLPSMKNPMPGPPSV